MVPASDNAQAASAASIRAAVSSDVPALQAVIDATGLFPSDMLPGMMAGYLTGEAPGEIWLTCDDGPPDSTPHAVAYCAPERMAHGTWNLLLIAVHPARQGYGIGTALMRHVESLLAASGERILLVETSGLPEFEGTRAFYRQIGYGVEALIREFYDAGEDKIVFRKALRPE